MPEDKCAGIRTTNDSNIMPSILSRPEKNQPEGNGKQSSVWGSGGHSRPEWETQSMDIKEPRSIDIQRSMDGRSSIHENMVSFAIIRAKIDEKILHSVKTRKTPPTRAKRKKWNNYTTKAKTTHQNPKE